MRKLYHIYIDHDENDNNYRLKPDKDSLDYGAKEFSINADDTMLKKFLYRCKVSDPLIQPRSHRSITYDEIVKMIQQQKGEVYVFAHMYPKTFDELNSIMRK